jgi:thiol-disulfide isomerase/thioredoxin
LDKGTPDEETYMVRLAAAVLVVIVLSGVVGAGEYNKKLSIGDAAPTWKDLPGTDGKKHSFDDLADKDVVVVVITCNHCPFASDYEDRLIAFAKKYAGRKVGVVAISISHEEDDSLAAMKVRAAEKGLPYPYLRDESQKIGVAYGATVTPEVFVLNKDRKIAYMGRVDDNCEKPAEVKKKYLEDAVESLLAGKKVAEPETKPYGCSLEYEDAGKGPSAKEKEKPAKSEEVKQTAGKVELKAVKYDDLVNVVRGQLGKVVVVDVWASWCPPCKREFPQLVKPHEKYARDGLVAISLTLDTAEGEKAALTFLQRVKADFANYRLVEPNEFAQKKLGFTGPPVVFVFDRNGKRAGKFSNDVAGRKPFSYEKDVTPLVEKLLKSKP